MNQEAQFNVVLSEMEAPQGLYAAVLERIVLARRRGAWIRVGLLSVFAFISGAALVSTLQYAGREFYASGFYDYMSLFASDRGFALSSWHEIAFSLLESLPSIALLLLLAIGISFVWSLRRVFYNARIAFGSTAQSAY